MALKGDLASVDLAQVFQMLALNQKVGLLSIQSPSAWKALYFDDRGVTLYFNEHTMLDRVLARLIRSGAIGADGVAEAREHAAHQGQTVVDSLLAGGYLSEQDLDEGIRNEIEEEIYELFFWNDAKFEFFEGATEFEGREGIIHDRFFFGTDILIMEAARRIDEWGYIQGQVPSGREIMRHVVGDTRAFDLDDDHFHIFELTDGKRNVERLIEITGIPSFHVFKVLSTLMDEGFVETVPLEELVPAGQECMAEGRMQDAINLFERAAVEKVGLPDVHTLASEAYDAIAEYELSSYHTKCVAEIHAENGERREAVDLFRYVLETIPTDLAACRRVVELCVGHPELTTEEFNALQVGKDLVDLYLEIGEVDQVKALLEDLLRENPGDIELKKSLINVHTKIGDTKRVIELYESIADDLQKTDPIQAIKYLQKVLQLNRSRTDISERIKSLYRADERKRSRRRSMVALSAFAVMLVVAGIGYFIYDQTARAYYNKLDIAPLVDKKDYNGAIRVVENFIASYPFTMVGKGAEGDLAMLRAQRRAHEAAVKQEADEAKTRLKRIRYQYKTAWQHHVTHFSEGKLTAAMTDIETVLDLVGKAGEAEDRHWLAANKVEKSLVELKEYLAKASALERQVRTLLDQGKWQEARTAVLKLIKNFAMSDQAKLAQIPVMCVTRPVGAMVYQNGKPLTKVVDGKETPIKTPTVVLCPNQKLVELTFLREGFRELTKRFAPHQLSHVGDVLTIVPTKTYAFPNPAQAKPGVGPDGTVAVALKGGRLGIARPGQAPTVLKLPGLGEVFGSPCVTSREVVFATNENRMYSYRFGSSTPTWEAKITHPLAFDPVIANSRAFLVDREARAFCLSVYEGKELWMRPLNGHASGQPFTGEQGGRYVAVGSGGGSALLLDAQKGRILKRLKLGVAVTSRVLATKSMLIFGTEDGRLRTYRMGGGKSPKWVIDVGRALRSDELALTGDGKSAVFVGSDNTIYRVSLFDGRIEVKQKLNFRIRPHITVHEGKVLVVVEETEIRKGVKAFAQDLLLAFDEHTFDVAWEFRDGGKFKGPLVKGSKRVYLTGSKGGVYQFR